MRRCMLAALVSCAVLAGQAVEQAPEQAAEPAKATDVFEKAPPEIEEGLRTSVSKFFQAHVDGKFRQAEEVIAEDSKDYFYNLEKKRYLGFEIVRINYSENFTKATVVTGVDMEWRSPRIGVMRVKPPMTSLWKLENGKWSWYVVPQKDWDTPWGRMNPGPDVQQQNKIMTLFKGVDAATVVRQVSLDVTDVRLSGFEPSEGKATISNAMPGDIQLRMDTPAMVGLDVKLDKTVVKSGEQAAITIRYQPPNTDPKPKASITVYVEPIGQVYRINLTFDIQSDIKKLLPQELQK